MEPSLPLSPSSPIFPENQHSAPMISRSKNSISSAPRVDQSDGRDPIFPDTARQLETILRSASEGWQNASEPRAAEPRVIIDRSKLNVLEDRFTVMQTRNVVLITENESLRSQ
ncbi:uncharacterized protein [Venturia canescens]|uniref:uncharacterized protein n=1 Tax=Venturia canescens TaxID=32260 RepID=UPI001C9CE2A7|nr:uncharacterized protein LOC122415222 [Venturia canescens]